MPADLKIDVKNTGDVGDCFRTFERKYYLRERKQNYLEESPENSKYNRDALFMLFRELSGIFFIAGFCKIASKYFVESV